MSKINGTQKSKTLPHLFLTTSLVLKQHGWNRSLRIHVPAYTDRLWICWFIRLSFLSAL